MGLVGEVQFHEVAVVAVDILVNQFRGLQLHEHVFVALLDFFQAEAVLQKSLA